MASKLKRHVSQRILERLKSYSGEPTWGKVYLPKHLLVGNNKDGTNVELHLPLNTLPQTLQGVFTARTIDVSELKSLLPDGKISSIYESTIKRNKSLAFSLNRNLFVGEVLNDMINKPEPYGNLTDIVPHPLGKTVIVEYSSPNIAKPFHMGHFRSTIIGNFIAKIHEHLAYNVIKINYLGDWGTQFGLLKVGLDLSEQSLDTIKRNPIQLLYEAYVKANQAAENDPNVSARAREVFLHMEQGLASDVEEWQAIKGYTVNELQGVYRRLGVLFSEYHWESMYGAKDIQSVLEEMRGKGILEMSDGKEVVELSEKRRVTVVKSDGTSLYLTRDIAAAMDRFEKHHFDEMIYVVDNAQTDHFTALFGTLEKMEIPWAHKLRHVKFGRVHGMSTRQGNVVFLKDILDETKSIMQKKQLQSPTTKVNMRMDSETTDILGITAIIVNDLKQRRTRHYEFDWEKAMQVDGDTGVKLQYAHCRLWSLEKNCGVSLPHECDPTALPEPEVTMLVQEIARFDDILRKSYEELEACILVIYLFQFCNVMNRAFKVLPVKGQDSHIASQRLMLFHASRLILNQGMRILGLKPLQEM